MVKEEGTGINGGPPINGAAALDAMEEGLLGPDAMALLEEGRAAVMESADPAHLARLALRVFEVFLQARLIHASLEGSRVMFRNQIRDMHLPENGGKAKNKEHAEKLARETQAYAEYVAQTDDAERIKDFAWALHDALRLCACAALRPELVQPAGPRPYRSAGHTMQGAAERGGRGT
jgi:hypothetical protein